MSVPEVSPHRSERRCWQIFYFWVVANLVWLQAAKAVAAMAKMMAEVVKAMVGSATKAVAVVKIWWWRRQRRWWRNSFHDFWTAGAEDEGQPAAPGPEGQTY